MSVIVKTTCPNDPTYHFFHGFFHERRKNFKNPLTNTRGCGIILYVRYVGREMNTCYAGVAQWQSSWFVISRLMVRLRSPAPYGSVPEWPKGTDCKSAAFSFGGPNPPAPTTRGQPLDPIHAHFIMRVFFFCDPRPRLLRRLTLCMNETHKTLIFCDQQALAISKKII